ncbi:Chromatin modification-related protein, partial [Drosera capensis]
MDLNGHHNVSSNPSGALASLLSKGAELHEELQSIEKQDPIQCGNVLKGFESFLSSSKTTTLMKRSRKFQPEDRLFSLSSITSPAAEDHALGREDSAPGRHKGSGMFGHGTGKPKKGRWAARDGRRIRQADPDFNYEDDPNLMTMTTVLLKVFTTIGTSNCETEEDALCTCGFFIGLFCISSLL